ncbi:MAG: LysR family transcriptional regulator [Gammaproteobacteria bacterium]|nr:LysR family transcriptional regulator [Gammaproteobacteria bacterium]MDP2347019.1 LysR family transcriptional regulator [Gammaproteobacteria bacterium]
MRSQELTLLHVFNAIMIEGSVTRAADLLGMTQPAVSNAIARMRDHWQDPLFIKHGRQIQPTAFASSLWEQVRDPIQQLSASVESSVFVPAESRRKFRIAMTDLSVDLFWLPLMTEVARLAPLVDLYAVPFTQIGAVDLLREARIDLALGPQGEQDRSLRSSFLYESAFKLVMRRDHPLAGRAVSMEDFLAARHLLVSRTGEAQGNVDRALQREGLKRRVATTVNHFSVVPKLLTGTDMIAVVPHRIAESPQFNSELWVTDSPICVEPRDIYLIWHARLDRDPGLAWLRKLLETVVREK